jgi:hypothetical protein
MLLAPAKAAGIKVPEDPDKYDKQEYMHFHVFEMIQLGAPMPFPDAHFQNAQLIAEFSEEEITKITYNDLLEKGLAIGNSNIYG